MERGKQTRDALAKHPELLQLLIEHATNRFVIDHSTACILVSLQLQLQFATPANIHSILFTQRSNSLTLFLILAIQFLQ